MKKIKSLFVTVFVALTVTLAILLAGCGQAPKPVTDEQVKETKICAVGFAIDREWGNLEVCLTELLAEYGIDTSNDLVDEVVDDLQDEYVIAIAKLFNILDKDSTILEIREDLKLAIKDWLATLLEDIGLETRK